MKFIRFGILKAQKQIHYDEVCNISPPAREGFFAFPFGFVEEFLLMNLHPTHHTQKTEWVKVDGEKIEVKFKDDKQYGYADDLTIELIEVLRKKKIPLKEVRLFHAKPNEDEGKLFLAKFKKRNYFTYKGEIWHHLHLLNDKIKPNEILQRFNQRWILTSAKTHEKYLKQTYNKFIFEDKIKDNLQSLKFDFDEFEVFIEKI